MVDYKTDITGNTAQRTVPLQEANKIKVKPTTSESETFVSVGGFEREQVEESNILQVASSLSKGELPSNAQMENVLESVKETLEENEDQLSRQGRVLSHDAENIIQSTQLLLEHKNRDENLQKIVKEANLMGQERRDDFLPLGIPQLEEDFSHFQPENDFLFAEDFHLSTSPENSSEHSSPLIDEIFIDLPNLTSSTNTPINFFSSSNLPSINLSNEEIQEPPKKRGRKRQRIDENADISAVKLTTEELLHISSEEVDELIQKRVCGRSLTLAEQKEIQKQKRRIKNRESAFAHRRRKKSETELVHQELQKLRQENAKLVSENLKMKTENYELKNENSEIRKKFNSLKDLLKQTGNISLQALQKFGEYSTKVEPETKKKASAYLIIFLFSFGFLFSFISNNPFQSSWNSSSSHLASSSTPTFPSPRHLLQLNTPIDSNQSVDNSLIENEFSDLESMEVEDQERKSEENSPLENGGNVKPLHEVKRYMSTLTRKRATEVPSSEQSNIDGFVNLRSTNKQTSSDVQFEEVYPNVFGEFMNESAPSNLSKLLELDAVHNKQNETESEFWDNVKIRPNTAYLKVDSFQHLTPPNHQPLSTTGEPVYISLLIPSKVFNQENNNPFVQIVTQLMDVSQSSKQLQLPSTSTTSFQMI